MGFWKSPPSPAPNSLLNNPSLKNPPASTLPRRPSQSHLPREGPEHLAEEALAEPFTKEHSAEAFAEEPFTEEPRGEPFQLRRSLKKKFMTCWTPLEMINISLLSDT